MTDLDAGTYELLRDRLQEQARELARRADALNTRRLGVFGDAGLTLVGTERLRTTDAAVPRDVAAVGDLLLFGFNRSSGTQVEDVLAVHDRTGFGKVAGPDGLLHDPQFRRDFSELYRYYKQARLLQLKTVEDRILAVFQTGPGARDVRVLRWKTTGSDVVYEDNRGERDHVPPGPYDFAWTETTRADHVQGRHPHVLVDGVVSVTAVGGSLVVRSEGEVRYEEPVDEPLQSLADAEVGYARIGPLVLLRVRPYNEKDPRHLVFNVLTQEVVRLDAVGQACRTLPEEQGIVFPGGYLLTDGGVKAFDTPYEGLEFARAIRSANGEDMLYVFYARATGRTLLLPYNIIRKEVATPLSCHGYALYEDGTLVVFTVESDEPTRVHPVQLWATPFLSEAYAAAQPVGTGPLERVGNTELVRGIADCLSVARADATDDKQSAALIAACTRAADRYHWLGSAELEDLGSAVAQIKETAGQILAEYAAVRELTAQAQDAAARAEREVVALVRRARGETLHSADDWVRLLAELRRTQGRLTSLREIRYVDAHSLDRLDTEVAAELDSAAHRAVEFLATPDAFSGYAAEVEQLAFEAGEIETVAQAAPVRSALDDRSAALEVVTEVVGGLDIADATVRTGILEHIGTVLGGVNRARAVLAARRRSLLDVEGRASFAAEFALLGQAVGGALAVADTPERCDEQLGRLLLRLEDLEARFAEFDDFLAGLEAKREDVYEAFEARKQALLDQRARRADRLGDSAARILSGVARRVLGLGSLDEVNTYFASDPTVLKLRAVAGELRDLGERVRAEELDGRILAARQEAGRALRDRLDLFDGDTLKLGPHRLAVNSRPVELTLVPHEGGMAYAITGTDYRAPVTGDAFAATKEFWSQEVVSETALVYRAEHLAASVLADGGTDVRQAAGERFDEGYERGVHDHDAALIFDAVLGLRDAAGLLRFTAEVRAAAQEFWAFATTAAERDAWTVRVGSLARAQALFGPAAELDLLRLELDAAIGVPGTGDYLVDELSSAEKGFVTSAPARALRDGFRRALGNETEAFEADVTKLENMESKRQLVEAWLGAYAATVDRVQDLAEAVAIELYDVPRYESDAELETVIAGLLGTHPRVHSGTMTVRLDEFLTRTREFRDVRVPAFRAYQRLRASLVAAEKRRLRLDEYKPKVLGSFVRNRLLDEVYLPLIGGNLAKQLGSAADVDQSGLLLLISPPGYGKTTLMEYVADRLGMLFVKVDGPALGEATVSLDPAEAPDATARQEVEKISFALEAGSNVLLYLDDIQHTSPELLQRFISLCDGQRRMEGVWQGRTRTYDLRGKRFAVCMSGNPYTSAGQRFRIPDMLANRADVWNLGDVLSGRERVFALSYLENALTSNPVLAPLAARERADVDLLVRMAQNDPTARPDKLVHPYGTVELDRMLAVLRRLVHVQETILTVNQAYIASAAQSDTGRVLPPFRLQGSYRNMNRLAERIVPAMNDSELDALIDDHYAGEAQTLAAGAEENLLRLAELRGRLTAEQTARWVEVREAFLRSRDPQDPVSRAVGELGERLERALGRGRGESPVRVD